MSSSSTHDLSTANAPASLTTRMEELKRIREIYESIIGDKAECRSGANEALYSVADSHRKDLTEGRQPSRIFEPREMESILREIYLKRHSNNGTNISDKLVPFVRPYSDTQMRDHFLALYNGSKQPTEHVDWATFLENVAAARSGSDRSDKRHTDATPLIAFAEAIQESSKIWAELFPVGTAQKREDHGISLQKDCTDQTASFYSV